MHKLSIIFLSLILVVSCGKKSGQEEPDLGYDYFPLETGRYRVYNVDSISYDNNTSQTRIDTFRFFYKEETGKSFSDADGKTAFFIKRYFTDSLHHAWLPANEWVARRDQLRAERVEENVRTVRQIYPLKQGGTWNGNIYNTLGEKEFTLDEYEVPYAANGLSFPSTIRVLHEERENFIEEIKQFERYAKGVGLVYFLHDSINTQVGGSRGYRYRLTLRSYN